MDIEIIRPGSHFKVLISFQSREGVLLSTHLQINETLKSALSRIGCIIENVALKDIIVSDQEHHLIYQHGIFKTELHDELSRNSHSNFDICEVIDSSAEFNIRVSAIIKQDGKILIDKGAYDPDHSVLIGGRLQMGESIVQGLRREISEELHIRDIRYSFKGVGEDFFTLKLNDSQSKEIHFLSYIFEVEILSGAISFDDGCEGVWVDPDVLESMHMSSCLPYL